MGSIITPTRRGFLVGLGTALATPFIVRASSIMPVKSLPSEMLKPRSPRKWRHVQITRGGADIVVLIDGQIAEIVDQDYGRTLLIRTDTGALRLRKPPPGSYQQFMEREHA